MTRISPEGYPFVFGMLLITAILCIFLIWNWEAGSYTFTFYLLLLTSWFLSVVTIFMAFFFRDPERKIPEGKGIFVSPADGKVILIKDVYEEDYLKSESKEISIFMSPLNVHVNRAPCDGNVSIVKYSPGKFKPAFSDDSSIKNENIVMVLDVEDGRVIVRQVAGFLTRRVVCRVKIGDSLRCGERYGIIKFGSRLDVYLPKEARIRVALGDKVRAGETVIGEI